MNRILNYVKTHKAETIVFSIIIILRLISFIFIDLVFCRDSYEYLKVDGFSIFKLQLDEWRVPIYPMLINIMQYWFASHALSVLCFLQFAFSIISSFYFYKIFKHISNKKFINLAFVLIYSLNGSIWGWDKTVMTESFALSFTIFIIYNFIKYLKEPNIKSAVYATCLITIGIFARPAMLVFVPILVAFFVLRAIFVKKERTVAIKSALISLISVALVLCYSALFFSQFGNFTLSNIQLSHKALIVSAKTGLYKNIDDKEILKIIWKYKDNGTFWTKDRRYIVTELRDAYPNGQNLQAISKVFDDAILKDPIQYGEYLYRTLLDNLNLHFIPLTAEMSGLLGEGSMVASVSIFGFSFGFGFMLSFICLGILLWDIIMHKKFGWLYFGLFGFIFSIYATTLIGTYGEYARVAIQALPFCYITLWALIIRGINFIKASKCQIVEAKEESLFVK